MLKNIFKPKDKDEPGSIKKPLMFKYSSNVDEEDDILERAKKLSKMEFKEEELKLLGLYKRDFTTMTIRKTFEKETLTCFRCHSTNIPRYVQDPEGTNLEIRFCPICNARIADILG